MSRTVASSVRLSAGQADPAVWCAPDVPEPVTTSALRALTRPGGGDVGDLLDRLEEVVDVVHCCFFGGRD
jgi:hypothetical protein